MIGDNLSRMYMKPRGNFTVRYAFFLLKHVGLSVQWKSLMNLYL